AFEALILRYCYGHQSFLAFYAMYLTLAPFVLWLMARGYTAIVLLASAALWLGALLVPGSSSWSAGFSEHSWQVIFVIGLAVGFHAEELGARLRRLAPAEREAIYKAAVIASLALVALSWLYFHNRSILYRQLFKREEIGPGRLLTSLI